ncbi:radical SAM protein [bacterium]|nr:radical SAM protein [candidate division CSSED10-310 bacterium]
MQPIDHIAAWWRGGTAPPYSIELSPTLRCNLRCRFCWQQGVTEVDHRNELPDELYASIVEQGRELGVREWRIIGGGESLCRRALTLDTMARIKRGGMYGYLCTNGSRFDEPTVRQTVEMGWDHLKISFESPDPGTQDFLSGIPGSFNCITRNIAMFRDHKRLLKTDTPFLELGMVLTNKNHHQLEAMMRLAHSLGVQAVFAEPITVYTALGASLKLHPAEAGDLDRYAGKAARLAERFGIQTNLRDFIQESRLVSDTGRMHNVLVHEATSDDPFLDAPCFEPWYRMGIRVDGVVCPCGFYDVSSHENIRDKSLREIWYGGYFQQRRREILEGRLPPHCAKCCTTLVVQNQRIRQQLIALRMG